MFFNVPQDDGPQPQPQPQSKSSSPEEEAYAFATELLEEGFSVTEARKEMLDAGFKRSLVTDVLNQLTEYRLSKKGRRERRRSAQTQDNYEIASERQREAELQAIHDAARTNILIGAGVCLIGLLVTGFSCMAASGPSGGPVVLAWGAVLFGAVQMVRGLAQASAK